MAARQTCVNHDHANRLVVDGIAYVRLNIILNRCFRIKHLQIEVALVMVAWNDVAWTRQLAKSFTYDLISLFCTAFGQVACYDKKFRQLILL